MSSLISIAHIPRKIALVTGSPAPSPRIIYQLALMAKFPAEFIGGRWFINTDDITKVVDALGLTVLPQSSESVA